MYMVIGHATQLIAASQERLVARMVYQALDNLQIHKLQVPLSLQLHLSITHFDITTCITLSFLLFPSSPALAQIALLATHATNRSPHATQGHLVQPDMSVCPGGRKDRPRYVPVYFRNSISEKSLQFSA